MTWDIALILAVDGIATGAIYVLIALGTVLIYSVTRVIFVPFGDIAAFSALTLASLQMGRLPGTTLLVCVLAAIALAMELIDLVRAGKLRRWPRAVLDYGIAPCLPALVALLVAGVRLPPGLDLLLAFALILPIAPLLDRIAFRPMADASTLLLLIVAVAVHFAISGLALLFFGPEGFRTEPLVRYSFSVGGLQVSGQTLIMVVAAAAFSGLLYLYFEYTTGGKALRATAVNRTGARLVGIRPTRAATRVYLLGSVLAAASGFLIGPVATLYYDSGFVIGLKAFVGAIIGGLVSYPLTVVGSMAVGLLETYASFLNSSLKEAIVFSALVPILILRSLIVGDDEEEDEEEEE